MLHTSISKDIINWLVLVWILGMLIMILIRGGLCEGGRDYGLETPSHSSAEASELLVWGPFFSKKLTYIKFGSSQLTNSPYKKVQDNNERSIRSEKKRSTMGPLCKMYIYSVVLGGKCIDMSTATCHMSMFMYI